MKHSSNLSRGAATLALVALGVVIGAPTIAGLVHGIRGITS